MSERIALVADDLTGALDAGVQFRNRGLPVTISLEKLLCGDTDWPGEGAGVRGITTDSRADKAAVAAEKLDWVGRRLVGWKVFKKIDSTLRGNLGIEIEALMRAQGAVKVVLAPAFPDQGRTTVSGIQLVHGIPVTEAGFSADPTAPVHDSLISRLLSRQVGLETDLIYLSVVEGGAEAIAQALRSSMAPVAVCDATSNAHLNNIAIGASKYDPPHFLCGSAGLAAAVAALAGPGDHVEPETALRRGPLLFVVGSQHPVTLGQVERLDIPKFPLLAESVAAGDYRSAAEGAARLLHDNQSVVVYIRAGEVLAGETELIATHMGTLASEIIFNVGQIGVLASGGDIAGAVCRSLGAAALRIENEVLKGVPLSTLCGGESNGLPLITKAGGFGEPDDLVRLHNWWTEKGNG